LIGAAVPGASWPAARRHFHRGGSDQSATFLSTTQQINEGLGLNADFNLDSVISRVASTCHSSCGQIHLFSAQPKPWAWKAACRSISMMIS
jgi:hypothetical protein